MNSKTRVCNKNYLDLRSRRVPGERDVEVNIRVCI